MFAEKAGSRKKIYFIHGSQSNSPLHVCCFYMRDTHSGPSVVFILLTTCLPSTVISQAGPGWRGDGKAQPREPAGYLARPGLPLLTQSSPGLRIPHIILYLSVSDHLASTVLLVPSVSRSSKAKGDSGQGILLGRGRGCTAWETRGCLEGAGRDGEAGSPAETKATRRWQEVRKGSFTKNKRGKDRKQASALCRFTRHLNTNDWIQSKKSLIYTVLWHF